MLWESLDLGRVQVTWLGGRRISRPSIEGDQ